ncbi:MAG: hypothetical protein JNL73_01125 [Anaerolineales bacterium]|nr:hypothetical protein [Anaerolineales bacterium]
MIYEIRVEGHLDRQWEEWFAGLRVSLEATGDTLLTGPLTDQAALYGVLKRVRDLGLPLVSLQRLGPEAQAGDEPVLRNVS